MEYSLNVLQAFFRWLYLKNPLHKSPIHLSSVYFFTWNLTLIMPLPISITQKNRAGLSFSGFTRNPLGHIWLPLLNNYGSYTIDRFLQWWDRLSHSKTVLFTMNPKSISYLWNNSQYYLMSRRNFFRLTLSLPNVKKKKFKTNNSDSDFQSWTWRPEGPTIYVTIYWKFPQWAACGTPSVAAEHVYKASY